MNKSPSNSLLKINNLSKLMKKEGIKRVSPRVYAKFEEYINKEIVKISKILAQNIKIKGRKTLEVEDINEVLNKKDNVDYPED